MTQLSPNTSVYARALSKLKGVNQQYADNEISTPEDYFAAVNNIAHEILSDGEKPNLFYDFIEHGQPALSSEYNKFWTSMSSDVNIIYDQINYLKAHVVSSYNSLTADIKKGSKENARLKGKLKTLQLYSTSVDSSVRVFGDFFTNYSSINLDITPTGSRAEIATGGILTLGKSNEVENLLSNATITIGGESNGFPGRNQEILDPELSPLDPITGEEILTFRSEESNYGNVIGISDDNANTWFEYEHNLVDKVERSAIGDLNFRYRDDLSSTGESYVDWASGPENDILKLVLDFDLGSVQNASRVSYVPHKVTSYDSHPVRVNRIIVSSNGADWTEVSSGIVWVGTDINISGTSSNEEVVIGTAVWEFNEQFIRYVKMEIDQIQSLPSNVGHMFFIEEANVEVISPDTGNILPETYAYTALDRVEGPVPTLSNLFRYYNPALALSNGLVQFREYFEGQRWVIGIRDISVDNVKYNESSTIISNPYRIDGEIDRVTIESDYIIPSSFNSGTEWIKFYVSPNDGIDWYQISDIQNSSYDVPEIISFNDPLPVEFQEEGIAYFDTKDRVDSILVRIDISRPSDMDSSTPVVKNYKLKVLKR